MKTAQFGSVSSATMRNEDLIPALIDTLRDLRGALPLDLYKSIRALQSYDSEDADYILETLFDALSDYAPPYGYFGAHPGDGSDYGFWLIEGFPGDDMFDGLTVADTSEVPANYTGEVLDINDHGNMTLYAARRGKLHEIWSLV